MNLPTTGRAAALIPAALRARTHTPQRSKQEEHSCPDCDRICRAFQLQPNEPGCLHWIDRDRGIKDGEV